MAKRPCRSCGQIVQTRYCHECGAAQYIADRQCFHCGESGEERKMRRVSVYFEWAWHRRHVRRWYCEGCGEAVAERLVSVLEANPWEAP